MPPNGTSGPSIRALKGRQDPAAGRQCRIAHALRARHHGGMAIARGLDHLVLVVADVDATLAWYGRVAGLGGVRVDDWRNGEAPFPSLRVDEGTIIDLVPGLEGDARGHLDHFCLVVDRTGFTQLAADPDLEIVDSGPRFGARGQAESIYVRDPDGLLVEFRTYD